MYILVERKLREYKGEEDENAETPSPSPTGLGAEITNHRGRLFPISNRYFAQASSFV